MGIIKKKSSTEYIIEHIVEQIRTGQLQPGDQLANERTLSEELGVSRMPLREAFSALSVLGVLEVRQGSGTYISEYDPEALGKIMNIYSIMNGVSVDDLFETRIIIEQEAIKLAIERASKEEMEEIHKSLEWSKQQMSTFSEQQALEKYYALNSFHKAISQASHNRYLQQFMDALRAVTGDFIVHAVENSFRNMEEGIVGHQEIYEAIKEKDKEKAAALIRQHLKEELEGIKKNLKEEHDEGSSDRISSTYTSREDGGRSVAAAAARA